MNKLNEALLSTASSHLVDDDDVTELVASMPPDFADAVNGGKKVAKDLEDKFKEQEKEKEAFIKDNHNTEFKVKGTKELKKMKLSESLFDTTNEAWEYNDATTPGIGACAPTVGDWSSGIKGALKHIDNPLEGNLARKSLKRYIEQLKDQLQEVENFNKYWTARYPAMIDYIDSQLTLIPADLLNELEADTVQEAVATAERPASNIFYKSKREPLADIIQRELTSGEVVYALNDKGKYVATHAPSLNLDEYDIGAGDDSNGSYIIARVAEESDCAAVEAIAKKYGKQFKSGYDKYISGNKYFTKIYIDDSDWDDPYVDPEAQVRVDGRKKMTA